MQNKFLIKIQKKLNKYFCYFKDDNILAISEDKMSSPFIYIISDYNYPNTLLLSIAVDYPNSINVAEVILVSSKIKHLSLSEPFYISMFDGRTYFDNEAYTKWDIDAIPLDKIEPENKSVH